MFESLWVWSDTSAGRLTMETDVSLETARRVALSYDGAVVLRDDGTVEEEMVRVKQLSADECRRIDDLPDTGWMGTRHTSALETSVREAAIAVITLSEEDGRVTVFNNGAFDDYQATPSADD